LLWVDFLMDELNKQDGLVVWYNERKGFGFVHIGE
jgi:hypothetical protein